MLKFLPPLQKQTGRWMHQTSGCTVFCRGGVTKSKKCGVSLAPLAPETSHLYDCLTCYSKKKWIILNTLPPPPKKNNNRIQYESATRGVGVPVVPWPSSLNPPLVKLRTVQNASLKSGVLYLYYRVFTNCQRKMWWCVVDNKM